MIEAQEKPGIQFIEFSVHSGTKIHAIADIKSSVLITVKLHLVLAKRSIQKIL